MKTFEFIDETTGNYYNVTYRIYDYTDDPSIGGYELQVEEIENHDTKEIVKFVDFSEDVQDEIRRQVDLHFEKNPL